MTENIAFLQTTYKGGKNVFAINLTWFHNKFILFCFELSLQLSKMILIVYLLMF